MPNISVSIRTADFPGGNPVPDVFCALYTALGVLLTTGTTLANGTLALGDRAAGTYELRVTPQATGYIVPQGGNVTSLVVAATGTQVFDLVMTLSSVSPPADAHLCRCYGNILTSTGAVARAVTLIFSECVVPNLLYYSGTNSSKIVVPSAVQVKTDTSGFVSVDLLRGASYAVTIAGYDNFSVVVEIPDLPTTSLPEVIFSVIDRIEYKNGANTLSPVAAPILALAVGAEVALATSVVYRSGLVKPGCALVVLSVEDPGGRVAVALTSGVVRVKGVSTGQAILRVARGDTEEKEKIWPTPEIRGTLTINIT